MLSREFDVLVFDWDGTLMDSEVHIVDCLRIAMHSVGVSGKEDLELRQVIGLGLPEAMRRLLPEASAGLVSRAIDVFRGEFLSERPVPSVLFEGAQALLDAARENGYMLAVATGKSRRGLDKVLAETGLGDYFVATRTADETFSKPHPRMLEEILVDLDTPASRALMIGDTEFDLQMALNAKVPSIGVSHGVHSSDRLVSCSPLAIVDSLPALGRWLFSYQGETRS